MVTIKEIAEIAGVHRSTVDKVLHGRPGVSPEVRAKVQKIIDGLEYRPNPLGLALKKKQEKVTLAAVLLTVDALESIRAGIEKARADYSAYDLEIIYEVLPYAEKARQAAVLHRLIDRRVSGILLMPADTRETCEAVDRAEAAGIPVITLNSDLPESRRTCFVGQDGYRAGCTAGCLMGEFLNGRGNVLLITDQLDNLERDLGGGPRDRGFQDVLAEQYPEVRVAAIIESHEDPFYIFQETARLLERMPEIDGIYITCGGVSEVGRAIRMASRERRIRLICFERYPEIVELLQKRVVTCTLDSDLKQQGYRPCEFLMNRLLYGKMPAGSCSYTTTRILVRENAEE
ncbi:MAG: LacI family DNA-binding transcriptional regulator [Intestinibacillus sp.]